MRMNTAGRGGAPGRLGGRRRRRSTAARPEPQQAGPPPGGSTLRPWGGRWCPRCRGWWRRPRVDGDLGSGRPAAAHPPSGRRRPGAVAQAHAEDGAAHFGGVAGALDPLAVGHEDLGPQSSRAHDSSSSVHQAFSDTEMAPIEVMAANDTTHSGSCACRWRPGRPCSTVLLDQEGAEASTRAMTSAKLQRSSS